LRTRWCAPLPKSVRAGVRVVVSANVAADPAVANFLHSASIRILTVAQFIQEIG
jgi:hypothetical protein